ncbi:MAG: hypothetical protein K2N18_03130, partial [Clostridia bacterium]|nr:hypothetical protein [Clostridia bacterium]
MYSYLGALSGGQPTMTQYTGNSYLYTIFDAEERSYIDAVPNLVTHDVWWTSGVSSTTTAITSWNVPNALISGNAANKAVYGTMDFSGGKVTEYSPNEMLFLLSYEDINNRDYGFKNADGSIYAGSTWTKWQDGMPSKDVGYNGTANYLNVTTLVGSYCLRNAAIYSANQNSHISVVMGTGSKAPGVVYNQHHSNTQYQSDVRPAFLFNTSKLVYATTNGGDYTDSFAQITSTTADCYKLFMADKKMDTSDANKPSLTFNADNSITATFNASAINAKATHAVALLSSNDATNTNGAVQYQATVALNGGNIATFDLPTDSSFNINDYKITVMLTTHNGGWDNETVYASYEYKNVWARYYDIEIASDGTTKVITEFALTKDKDPDIVEFGDDLYNPETDGHGKTNHKFLGWITAQEITGLADLPNIKTKAIGLPVEVDLYAVWGVDVNDITASITPSINSGTLTWNTGDTQASAVYAPGRTVSLKATPISVKSSLGFNIATDDMSFQWKKAGSDISRAVTDTYANIKNVSDTNTYSYEYLFFDKFQPLWIGTGTATALKVTINAPELHPTDLSTVQTAYVGAPYNTITPKATMQDPYGNTITGTTEWQYNLASSIVPDDPTVTGYIEGKVWATFFFTPDGSYDGNYGNGKVDPLDDTIKEIVYHY